MLRSKQHLAISLDQTLGLVAYSYPVWVINLVNDKKRQLDGFITPRSIIFSPDGRVFTSAIVLLDLLQYSMARR